MLLFLFERMHEVDENPYENTVKHVQKSSLQLECMG